MAETKDILMDDNNDIQFVNGDFHIGESDAQHIRHIIEATKGNFIESPTLGVNISEYKNGNINQAEISKRMRVELTKDGYYINSLSVKGQEISIDAKRSE